MSVNSHVRRRAHRGKATRRRGKKHHPVTALTQEDVDYLKKNTRYDEQEIREWYKGFKASRLPWGLLPLA